MSQMLVLKPPRYTLRFAGAGAGAAVSNVGTGIATVGSAMLVLVL